MTKIIALTQEHLDWWDKLPELWKKIFCVSIYHPEKNEILITPNRYEYIGVDDSDDFGYFTVAYENPVLEKPEDLSRVFALESIVFTRENNPALDSVVTKIPSLRYFIQLKVVILDYNYLVDISELAGVTSLQHLSLYECFCIEDYSPISTLIGLMTLNLGYCSIKDISFVSNLPQLRELSLWNNRISDIFPLVGLKQLAILEMNGNPIQDIRPLTNLTQLRHLEIGIEDPYEGRTFDYDNLQLLKEKLPNTKIEVLWNCFFPLSDKEFIQRIAFEGLKKNDKNDELRMGELIKQYENSQDSDLQQLASLVADEYGKRVIYDLHDRMVNAQSEMIKAINILLRNNVEAKRIINKINQYAKTATSSGISQEEVYSTQFQQILWWLSEMGIEILIRKK